MFAFFKIILRPSPVKMFRFFRFDYIWLSWARTTLAPELKSNPPSPIFWVQTVAPGHNSLCKLFQEKKRQKENTLLNF